MHRYEVGKPYHADRKIWPQGSQFNFRGGELELVLFFDRPSRHEVAAAKSGEAEFGLYVDGDLIVLCYRFGAGKGIPWSDAPYTIHLVPPADRVPPPDPASLTPESRILLHIILVNTTGGEILVLRAVTLAPDFTRALYAAIQDQAARPFDRPAYESAIDQLYSRFSTSDLLAQACSVTTKGGA